MVVAYCRLQNRTTTKKKKPEPPVKKVVAVTCEKWLLMTDAVLMISLRLFWKEVAYEG